MKKNIVKNSTATATGSGANEPAATTRGRKPGGQNFTPFKIGELVALIGSHRDAEIRVSSKWVKTFQTVFPPTNVAAPAQKPATETAEFNVA